VVSSPAASARRKRCSSTRQHLEDLAPVARHQARARGGLGNRVELPHRLGLVRASTEVEGDREPLQLHLLLRPRRVGRERREHPAPAVGLRLELEPVRADVDDTLHPDAGPHVLARPAAHDRDDRVAPDEPLDLGTRLGRRRRVLRPRDDRREHAVKVEEDARLRRPRRQPRENFVRSGHAGLRYFPARHNPLVPDLDELWIPLVDEPIGRIVDRVLREDPALAARVETPHRILAFKTFAYIRTGLVLGQLLFDHDVSDWDGSDSWVDALLRDPAHRAAIEREVRTVAEEIASDPQYADDEPIAPDEGARDRFRAFAREHLGRSG
jgi:hypothetical protein